MISTGYPLMQPIYPLLIQQLIDDYHLSDGIAMDIGVGPGFMGLELAKATRMKIVSVDISSESLELAKANYEKLGADNELSFIQANVENLPFADGYADFIMSRGSIWFWENPQQGLREIYRVLKPGGTAFVGGGLGRYMPITMRNRLYAAMQKNMKKRGEKRPDLKSFEAMVKKAGLPDYAILTDGDDRSGKWVEIRK